MRNTLIAGLVAVGLAGCSVMGTGKNDQLIVDSAGDAGAVSCAIGKKQLKPADLTKAKLAVLAAKTVLKDPEPKLSDIQAALEAGVGPEWSDVVAVLVQRLKKRLNGADVLPTDSVAWKAVEEAIDACELALG